MQTQQSAHDCTAWRRMYCRLRESQPTLTLGAHVCRRIVASAHAAFQRPLQGRPYHDLGRKGVVPFLAPSDGVPFACFLTLHRASASSCEERPAVQAAAQHEVMELVYVLDGSGQVPRGTMRTRPPVSRACLGQLQY